ncbi:MAG: HAMP domain-containing histidine kinase [Negativicutes bacterium]|nr:HAMP domain-containing histidine kinase [Negativicutes bacterium]
MIRSIFGKILLSHVAVILVTTATMALLMSILVRNYAVENKRQDLMQKGKGVIALVTPLIKDGKTPGNLEIIGDLVGANAWLMDSTNRVVAGKAPERWVKRYESSEEFRELFDGNPQSWVRTGRRQADPSVVVALPVPNTSPRLALFLYTPITGVTRAAQAVETLLGYALFTGVAAALLIAFCIARNMTRPIENIIKSADDFAQGRLETRTTAVGPDEIGRLGQTFNSMAQSLAAIEQNRREFLANVSHELKTPVAAIQALAESLADGVVTDPAQQKRYINNIVAATGRIGRLIEDLTDLAKLEAGEINIHPDTLELRPFLENHLDSLSHLLSEKNLRITIHEKLKTPLVKADPYRLAQVITNLISNAARYAPPASEITLSLQSSGHFTIIKVTDQGPGIPAADLPFIFDRFYRVEKSRARTDGGTGLGLAISKKLMNAMGGGISAESVEGRGATFILTLPAGNMCAGA